MPTKNPTKEQKRKWNLSARYGMTEADYQAMLAKQHGKCALCECRLTEAVRPVVDHCHNTGKVRGILCHECNVKLPAVEDYSFVMLAWAYLEDCG